MAKRTFAFAAAFAALLSFALSVQAENYDYYWKGGSGNYFTQSNWQLSDGTAAPVALDSSGNAITAYVQASGSAVTFDYSILGAAVRSLTIGGGSGSASVTRNSNSSLTIDSDKFISVLNNGLLTVQNTLIINANGAMSVNGGSLSTTGVDVSGTFDYTSGSNFVNSNTININAGGSFNIAGSGQFRMNGTYSIMNIMGGSVYIDSISYIGVTANGVINQSGGNATFNKSLVFGWGAGNGTYNLSGGTLTTTDNAGLWCSKTTGFNTFNMTGGTANFNKTGNSFAVGLYDDGTGTQWTARSVANVFNLYSGTVNASDTFAIQYGGTLNVAKNGATGGDGVLNAKAITISNGGNLNISSGTVNVGEGGTTLSGGTITISGSGLLKSSTIDVATGTTLKYDNTVPHNEAPLTFNVTGGTLEFFNNTETAAGHNANIAICSGLENQGVTINGTGGTLHITGGGCVAALNNKLSNVTFALDANSVIYVENGWFVNGGYATQIWTNNQAELRLGANGKVELWDGAQMKVGGLSGEAGSKLVETKGGNGISIGNGVTANQSYTYNGIISLNGKNIDFNGAGKQTLNGDITAVNMYNKAGTLILGKAGNNMKINSGVLIKADGGAVQVDGNLIVESGTFYPGGTWSTGTGTVTVKSGAQMRVGGTFGSTIGVTLDGGLLFNDGDHGGKNATVSSPINVKSNSQIQSGWTNGTLTLNGPLTGNGKLTVTSDIGTVVMATTCSDNSFTGIVQLNYGSATSQGQMQLGANQPFGANAGQANIYGTLDMHGYSQTFKGLTNDGDKGSIYNNTDSLSTLTLDTTGKDLTFQSSITGKIALVVKGTGTQTLSKAPGYTGSTTLESGTLVLSKGGTLYNFSGAGNLNYGANGLTLTNTADTVFSGALTGSGKVTFQNGTGWIELTQPGTFTGDVQLNYNSTTLEQGRVRLGADNALGTANRAYVYGSIDMNGYDQSFAGLSNDGNKGSIFNDTDTLSTLTIDTTSLTESSKFHSSIEGNIALVLTGTGIMTLTKAPEYTGSTTIESGTLALQADENTLYNLSGGSVNANDEITASATLDASGKALTLDNSETTKFVGTIKAASIEKTGDGTLQIYTGAEGSVDAQSLLVSSGRLDLKGVMAGSLTVNAPGVFSPGNSVGEATVNDTFILNAGAKLLMEQDATGMDKLNAGEFEISPDAILELTFAGVSGTYDILVQDEDFDGQYASDDFWNGLLTPESTYFWNLTVSGNIVRAYVDANAVPEPSTWALLILGAAGLMYWRKRK